MRGTRTAALVLCALMLALMPAGAMAFTEGEVASPSSITDPNASIILASVGTDGTVIPAVSGNAGDRVQVRLPLFNRSISSLTKILVTPQISATLDSFPFDIEATNYTCSVGDMMPGQIREVNYSFKISKDATSGVKEVKFSIMDFNFYKQAFEATTVSVFVTVVKGAAAAQTDDKGQVITTTPKIILSGYSYKPEKEEDQAAGHLYAGEKFTLSLTIENTSSEEAVRNIQLTLSNEAGVILPADSGSNTVYISKIGPGESVEKTLEFQSAPDAEAKAQSLAAKFNYESAKTLKSYEAAETLSLPLMQRMRVRIDDPAVYGDALLGSSMPISFSLYNMGKSSIYNCMVEVEGEGLAMEESFYGGNVAAGSTMQADFNVIPSVAGEITGTVIVTYEDVYGEQTRVEKPLTLNVQDASAMQGGEGMEGPGAGKPGMIDGGGAEAFNPNGGAPAGLPVWAYIAIGAAALLGIGALVVVLRRKRRRKHLEEL